VAGTGGIYVVVDGGTHQAVFVGRSRDVDRRVAEWPGIAAWRGIPGEARIAVREDDRVARVILEQHGLDHYGRQPG
jgi:hypothetical protein